VRPQCRWVGIDEALLRPRPRQLPSSPNVSLGCGRLCTLQCACILCGAVHASSVFPVSVFPPAMFVCMWEPIVNRPPLMRGPECFALGGLGATGGCFCGMHRAGFVRLCAVLLRDLARLLTQLGPAFLRAYNTTVFPSRCSACWGMIFGRFPSPCVRFMLCQSVFFLCAPLRGRVLCIGLPWRLHPASTCCQYVCHAAAAIEGRGTFYCMKCGI